MRINVLGSFGAEIDGNEIPLGGPQQRLILALLVAAGGDLVTTDQLIDRIWGDDLPDTPRKTVQVYIANLRSAIGGDRTPIHTEGGGYRLVIEEDDVDANRFARLVTEARSQLRTHPRPAAEGLEEALGLWRGPPYADLSYLDALQSEIRRLEELRLVALEDLPEADLEAGNAKKAVADLEALTVRHPLRERPCGLLMLAQYRTGQQASALRTYQDLRSRLVEELGIDPSPELQVLEQRILNQDAELLSLGEEAPLALPSGTVTFLFTDIEGSTRLWEEQKQAMSEALKSHDRLVREAIDTNGGYVFSTAGDGFAVAFASAVDAISAAVDAQRAILEDQAPLSLGVRMGIHTGEATLRDGDYFGGRSTGAPG